MKVIDKLIINDKPPEYKSVVWIDTSDNYIPKIWNSGDWGPMNQGGNYIIPYDNIPIEDSVTGNSGSSIKYSRGDHSHPSDKSKQDIIINENTIPEAIKDYVDAHSGGGGGGEENVIEAITMNDAPVPVTNKTAAITETDPTVPSWAKQPNKPSYQYSEIGNTPDLSGFITKSVNDLTNYYLKSETYTKAEVAALIGAIQQFHYEIYATLPSSGESNVLYLIGPIGGGSDKYEEYVYSNGFFTKIGDTSIDLSGYVTTSALNTALSEYTPTSNLASVATSGSYNDLINKPTIPQSQVFWATYGTTTAAEINAAVAAGKICLCAYNNKVYTQSYIDTNYIYFYSITGTNSTVHYFIYVKISNNTWNGVYYTLQRSFEKVSTIAGNETNTTKYPNTKAVADALGKWGVVSQKITYIKDTNDAWSYTISDVEWGLIPNLFIEEIRATPYPPVFNEQSGYFEFNGLTNISYKEMLRIYFFKYKLKYYSGGDMFAFLEKPSNNTVYKSVPLRTLYPLDAGSMNVGGSYFRSMNTIEVLSIFPYEYISANTNKVSFANSANIAYCFYNACWLLKKVTPVLNCNTNTTFANTSFQIPTIESIKIEKLHSNIWFSLCSKLSLESIVFMVQNATNTSAITITLHTNALARCTADTTEYEYNGNTYTGIVALATAKNITLAS